MEIGKFMSGCLLPPANEVWGKVIFLHLSVILFTGGCLVPRGDAWSRGSAWSGGGGCLVAEAGLLPGGGAWSRGSALGGCLVETPTRRLLLRVVRILLECILVLILALFDIFSDILFLVELTRNNCSYLKQNKL